MKRKKMKMLTVLMAIAVGASFWLGARTAYADNIYVTKAGWPDPDGSSGKPYQMVEAGIVRAKSLPGSTVLIGGGKYYETLTIDTPCTLTATGGTATIGKMDYTASTTLDIITLNTHLAGDVIPMPSWEDCWRAVDIAHFFAEQNIWPDVVAFQEIWDEDYFLGGDSCNDGRAMYKEAGYDYGRHGEIEGIDIVPPPPTPSPNVMNSGLALMSDYPLSGFVQVEWDVEGGDWPTAKGFIYATIIKDEFSIGLFTLHTKAEYDADDRAIRSEQLFQLVNAVNDYRVNHPDHVVFVMGDFNIKGEGNEYYDFLIGWMQLAGGKDADRNSPGFDVDAGNRDQWTSDDSNLLSYYFNSADNGRLDYIFYITSPGVEVLPTYVDVRPFTGRDYPVCISRIIDPFGAPHCMPPYTYELTNESSDHYSVYGRFKLIRTQ